MDIVAILAFTYSGLMLTSAITALICGEIKRRRELVPVKS